jgi:aminobenzoyl-glutamate transport protein
VSEAKPGGGSSAGAGAGGLLGAIERVGNALPDPTTLFLLGAVAVMLASQLAVSLDWSVEKTLSRDGERVIEVLRARSLLSSQGIYWAISSLVDNFKDFPPLAIVLVGMLGIGVADRTGLLGALLKALLVAVPPALLTPAVFFVGVLSSVALDAGYVVLPPVAAALYHAVGRSPLVGLAAVFAGVSAGFSANLVVTSLDALLAGLSEAGAAILAPDYAVAATANLYFMIASTVVLTGIGWAVTQLWVEPRFANKAPEDGGPLPAAERDPEATTLTDAERRGLRVAFVAATAALGAMTAASWIPGAPLHGMDGRFPRWVEAIIPLIFLAFLVPGLAYGIATRGIRSDRDAARMMGETMSAMGPYIVLAFFAAQFIEYFRYSGLGEMCAIAGGQALARAALPAPLLMVAFVLVVAVANLFIGSMSAISPELTQAAYRIGDSVSNVITPLNPYVIIILVFMQRWVPKAGIGTLVALMLPYACAFLLAWSLLLVGWMLLGIDLGPGGPLTYTAPT